MKKKLLFWIYLLATVADLSVRFLASGSLVFLPSAHSLAWGFDLFVAFSLFEGSRIASGIVLVILAANAVFFLLSAIQAMRGRYKLLTVYMPVELLLSAVILIVGAINTCTVHFAFLPGILISTLLFLLFIRAQAELLKS